MALLERSDSYGEMQRVVDYLFKNTPIVERLDSGSGDVRCVCRHARNRRSVAAGRVYAHRFVPADELLDCRSWLGLHLRHCGVGRRPGASVGRRPLCRRAHFDAFA